MLQSSPFLRVFMAAASCTAWMFVSSWLIVLNRHILVDLGFPYPMTLSGLGMGASFVLAWLCCVPFKLVETKAQGVTQAFFATRILPVGFFMAVTLWAGNLVYMYLSISFIQMLKAFTPVITMGCLIVAGLESFSRHVAASVVLITVGTGIAAYGEVHLTLVGLVLNTAGAVSESIRLVMTQWLLTGFKLHPIEGLMYLSPACMVWLYAGAIICEGPKMVRNQAWMVLYEPGTGAPIKFALATILGFLVNVLSLISIKLASSLTLKVLGTAKNSLLVVFSVMFLGEIVTPIQAVGYAIALAGFAWYNHLKGQEIASGASSHASSKTVAAAEGKGGKDGVEAAGNLKADDDVNGHLMGGRDGGGLAVGGPATVKPIVMDSAGGLTQPLLSFFKPQGVRAS